MTDPNSGDFWSKAADKKRAEADSARHDADPDVQQARRRRRRRLLWLTFLGGPLLLIIILVLLAPTIAGGLAPGMIRDAAASSIKGRVEVDDVSLSWFGPQRVQGFRLIDPEGKRVARLNLEATPSLLSLAFGSRDLGTVTLTGVDLDLVRAADGTTNLDRTLEPPATPGPPPATPPSTAPSAPAKPVTLPKGLAAQVIARSIDITYTDLTQPGSDPSRPTVTIKDADASLRFIVGGLARLQVNAKPAAGAGNAGDLSIDATVNTWSRDDGTLRLSSAKVDATITASNLPTALVDAFVAPRPGAAPYREALGSTLNLSLAARGSTDDANASLTLTSQRLSSNATLTYNGATLTSTLAARVQGQALAGLLPELRKPLLEQGPARLTQIPDIELNLTNLRLPFVVGQPLSDLRGSAVNLTATIGSMAGQVALEGAPTRAFTIEPLALTITTADLAQGASITAGTRATLDGQPAGDLALSAQASGLLDSSGKPKTAVPSSLAATFSIRGMATPIAQPFVQALGLDLANDLGPTLDLSLSAATETPEPGATPSANPPAAITFSIASQHLRGSGNLRITDALIATTGDGIALQLDTLGRVASRLVPASSGWSVTPGADSAGPASLLLSNLRLPRDAQGLALDRARGSLTLRASALLLTPNTPDAPPASPIALSTSQLNLNLLDGGSADLALNVQAQYDNTPFSAVGTFAIPGLITRADGRIATAAPLSLRPRGEFTLANVPTRLARLFVPAPKPGSPDVARLIEEAVGPSIRLIATTQPGANNTLAATLDTRGERLTSLFKSELSPDTLNIQELWAQATVQPAGLGGMLTALGISVEGLPSLAGPARLALALDPQRIPLNPDFSPALDRAGRTRVRLAMQGTTMVSGLKVRQPGENGSPDTIRDLGRVGVKDFWIVAAVDPAAILGVTTGEQRLATVDLDGTLLGEDETPAAVLKGQARVELSRGQLAGPASLRLDLTDVRLRTLEKLIGQEGNLTGALGESAGLNLAVALTPPADQPAFDLTSATIDAELALRAQNLRSDGPLKVSIRPDRILLTEPARFTFTVNPRWINDRLTPAATPGAPAPQAQLALRDGTNLQLSITTLSLPRSLAKPAAAGETPPATSTTTAVLASDIFRAGITLLIPSIELTTREGLPVRMTGTQFSIETPRPAERKPGDPPPPPVTDIPLNIRLAVAETAVGQNPPAQGMSLTGSITRLVSPAGQLSPDRALFNAAGELPAIPTALVDAFMNQDGVIAEALGPVVALSLRAERLPLTGGAALLAGGDGPDAPLLELRARSPRAEADLAGSIRNARFEAAAPVRVSLSEITQALANRLVKGLPVVGSIEKTAQDDPALVTMTGLTAPLGPDMSQLNGSIVINPGTLRFGTSSAFGRILKAVHQRQSGIVGQRLQPLTISITSGVATYERYRLPLGEFSVETEGRIDLVKREIDVVTWVPFGALADEAAGRFNSGLGSLLGRASPAIEAASLMPFRTRGPMDSPSTSPDVELWLRTTVDKLNPADAIRRGLGDLLPKPPSSPPSAPPR